MRDLIKETYPNLLTYRYSTNYLNLLKKKVMHPDIIKNVVEVQKYYQHISNTHQPSIYAFDWRFINFLSKKTTKYFGFTITFNFTFKEVAM